MNSIYRKDFIIMMAISCARGDTNLFSLNHTEKQEIGRLASQAVFLRQILSSYPASNKHDAEEPHYDISKTPLSGGRAY